MERIDEKKIALCALNRIFGFEPRLGLAILGHTGDPAAPFCMTREELRELIGPNPKYLPLLCRKSLDEASSELERIYSAGCRFTGITEEGYPALLKECEDPPIGLYVKSGSDDADVFVKRPAIAVVGTRDMSPYGKEWCEKMIYAISKSKYKPMIVSGLAIGIDCTAHSAALRCGLPTAAVMATGIDSVYPSRHGWLADTIVSAPGSALVTDYPPGTAPLAIHFLRRNRIIAGLSDAVILVESRARGGGMMTARLAFSYDRPVYALQGRADDIRSQGCNILIRDKIADPIVSPEDLVGKLGLGKVEAVRAVSLEKSVREFYGESRPAEEVDRLVTIAKLIRKNRGITPEELCAETGWDYPGVVQCTGTLEYDGFISMDMLRRCTYNTKFV